MTGRILTYGFILCSLLCTSCFKEIDTEPIPRTVDQTFTVQNSIRQVQSYFRFYENTVLEVHTASPFSWDLSFESAGDGNRVVTGWPGSSDVIPSGKYNMEEITQDLIVDFIDNSDEWTFDDPSYINVIDSLSLRNWEDGEVYIHKRGSESDTYYAIQFVSRDEETYTFRYASALALDSVFEATVYRSTGFNYQCYSYTEHSVVEVEPLRSEWDIVCTPYNGWWESAVTGEFAPFYQSGILINNEYGVRIARIFDPDVEFADITFATTDTATFIDMKGAIGANWKLLGAVGSDNLFTMDPDKKYLMKKYDLETDREMYFKLQIVDYKLDGEDHHPTIEFAYLGSK